MFYVYLLSSGPFGTLYAGMTADLANRVWEHKIKAIPGFTAKYGVDRLVWYEPHASLEAAFVRERQIKKWKREWKVQLIEADNPQWLDLYTSIAL
jgi:putative endonuclease